VGVATGETIVATQCSAEGRHGARDSIVATTIGLVYVRLLAFASAADAVGAPEQRLDLPDVSGEATVGALRRTLGARFPALVPLLPRLAVAVDGEVVGDAAALVEGAEVALLPPVSGG